MERRLLQLAIVLAGIVPVTAGGWGALGGLGEASGSTDSHARYLSGLLLGIGLSFWASVPTIEHRGGTVRLLTAIVVLGGLARLAAAPSTGLGPSIAFALAMELVVTPALAIWRESLAHRLRTGGDQSRP